jgi:hypothetical protein
MRLISTTLKVGCATVDFRELLYVSLTAVSSVATVAMMFHWVILKQDLNCLMDHVFAQHLHVCQVLIVRYPREKNNE